MVFFKEDFGTLITLRKTRGRDTDTGEDSTVRLMNGGFGIAAYPLEYDEDFCVGHAPLPTVSAGVFHAWYSTRLVKNPREVRDETKEGITQDSYAKPLRSLLRRMYHLDY